MRSPGATWMAARSTTASVSESGSSHVSRSRPALSSHLMVAMDGKQTPRRRIARDAPPRAS